MADDLASHFLGTGWTFPPTFSRMRDAVEMSSDDANIKQCLRVLFGTAIGERLMLDAYGSNLRLRVFDALTAAVENEIRTAVQKAILNWEPRIDVISIDIVEQAPLAGRLSISIDYLVRKTNSRSNLVYPFYLTEATTALPPT